MHRGNMNSALPFAITVTTGFALRPSVVPIKLNRVEI
jgi:hypothetical protein